MQIYKINVDTNKPITQRIAVPQDCDKYGLVVSATTNGHATKNLSCTIYDGDNTLTPSKTLDDGSLLFVMSSIGNTSRAVKVKLEAKPLLIYCTVNVQLDEVRGALPDGEITDDPAVYEDVRATSLSADTITLSGVNDTPTTITLEGIEYNVLAATANI